MIDNPEPEVILQGARRFAQVLRYLATTDNRPCPIQGNLYVLSEDGNFGEAIPVRSERLGEQGIQYEVTIVVPFGDLPGTIVAFGRMSEDDWTLTTANMALNLMAHESLVKREKHLAQLQAEEEENDNDNSNT